VRESIQAFALSELAGAELIGTIDSPITGTDGNKEFLMGLSRR
jgi:23S rRNA (cytidine1920-2'-O)/16S rRNA (cytidine1409-2'-O)-methyltransferase